MRRRESSRGPRRRLRLAAVVLLLAALIVVGTGALYYWTLPGVGDSEARVAHILRSHSGRDARVSPHSRVARAVVAIEDRRFYSHGALDFVAIARAFTSSITAPSADAGGSTITQQLAKALYTSGSASLGGRLKQIALAFKLEQRYSKSQIVEMYFNAIYYGNGLWGVWQASEGYFGKTPAQLDWAEASMLAGLPQAPSAYDPKHHFALARARQRSVLRQLVNTGALGQAQATRSYNELTSLSA